jgi:hypothetical protein
VPSSSPAVPALVSTTATVTVTRPPGQKDSSSSNTGPFLLAAAIIALAGVVITQVVQGSLTRRSNQTSQDALAASRETSEAQGRRAEADARATRYSDAAEQLGHEKAPVRLAGVYAMARLADDWADERQTCVDVLCAYLRMPWDLPTGTITTVDELQVRSTIVSVIDRHIRNDFDGQSWQRLRFDLRGADLLDVSFRDGTFLGDVDFSNVRFHGLLNTFESMTFSGDTSLFNVEVLGSLHFYGLSTAGRFWMLGTKISADAHLSISFAHVKAPEEISPGVETNDSVRLDNFEIAGRCNIVLARQAGARVFIAMGSAELKENALFTAAGRPLTPVDDEQESLVFPTLLLSNWIVHPGATVKTSGLAADGNAQWTGSDVAKSARVEIN